jgi:hypothetical protein
MRAIYCADGVPPIASLSHVRRLRTRAKRARDRASFRPSVA